MKIEAVVCNVCQTVGRPTTEYEVIREGRRGKVDLCEEHGAPFEEALGPAPRKARARRGGIEVTPLDQVR